VPSLRKPGNPSIFFLKLPTCTYFKSFNRNPDPRLFECGNFQKLTPRGYNKIPEPPNTWFRGQTRCGLSLLNIETKFACCQLVSLSMPGFVLSGPFAWALALVKPNTSGLRKGHPAFPSTYSIMQEVSLPQIRLVGAPDVWPRVSCPEYVVNSMVRFVWGHVA